MFNIPGSISIFKKQTPPQPPTSHQTPPPILSEESFIWVLNPSPIDLLMEELTHLKEKLRDHDSKLSRLRYNEAYWQKWKHVKEYGPTTLLGSALTLVSFPIALGVTTTFFTGKFIYDKTMGTPIDIEYASKQQCLEKVGQVEHQLIQLQWESHADNIAQHATELESTEMEKTIRHIHRLLDEKINELKEKAAKIKEEIRFIDIKWYFIQDQEHSKKSIKIKKYEHHIDSYNAYLKLLDTQITTLQQQQNKLQIDQLDIVLAVCPEARQEWAKALIHVRDVS